MKTVIENILIILSATIIMTFVITSIEKANSHGNYEYGTKEEKMEVYHQYLDFTEGRN